MPPSPRPAFSPRYVSAHLPGAVHLLLPPLKRRNVAWTALACAVVAYTCISLTTAYYFGTSVDGSCNINWVLYHPGANGMWTPLAWRFSGTSGVCYGFFPSVGRDERLPPERHGASIEISAARQAVHQIFSWRRIIGTPPPPKKRTKIMWKTLTKQSKEWINK